jgi:hypothetical protein
MYVDVDDVDILKPLEVDTQPYSSKNVKTNVGSI